MPHVMTVSRVSPTYFSYCVNLGIFSFRFLQKKTGKTGKTLILKNFLYMWPLEDYRSLTTRCKYTQIQEIYGLKNRQELNGMLVKFVKFVDDDKEEVIEATKFQELYKYFYSKIQSNTPIFIIKKSNLRSWYGLDPWVNTIEFTFSVRTECSYARKHKKLKNNSGETYKSDDEYDEDETVLAVYFSSIHYRKKDIKLNNQDYNDRIVLPETRLIFKSKHGKANNYMVHSPDDKGFQLNDLLEALRFFVFKEQTIKYNPYECLFGGFETERDNEDIVLNPVFEDYEYAY